MALAAPDAAVVLELMTMGQQSAAHLWDLLRAVSPSSSSSHQEVAAEILGCCGRVIATLKQANGKKRKPVDRDNAAAASPTPSTPPRKRARGGGDAMIGVVTSGKTEDGFIWRKYGQKEINGHKHQRLYYRCAYKHQGCTATRRVQRTHEENELPAYEIAYYGEHTCRGAATHQQEDAVALPPNVVDFGSNNAAWGCGPLPAHAAPEQLWSSWDGETSQGGWSSSSSASSSDVGFEAQVTHDTAPQVEVEVEVPSDPVTEFLDGCFDWEWESFVNQGPFDFGGQLPPSHSNAPGP